MNIRKFIEENLLDKNKRLDSFKCKNKEWFIKNNYVDEYNTIDTYLEWFSKYPDLKISFKINCILQNLEDEPLCPECGYPMIKNDIKFSHFKSLRYCSKKCAHNSVKMKEKIKKTNLKKYGAEYPNKSDNVKNKIKSTNLKRYGVENPNQYKHIQEKIKNTCLEKYGVNHNLKIPEVREKIKKSYLNNFNETHPMKSKEVKDKIKNTNLERYGVENPNQYKHIQEKIKNTCLEKYGVNHNLKIPEVREKIKEKVLKKNSKKEPLFYNKELAMEVYNKGGFELYKNSLNNEYENKWIKQRLFHLGVIDRKEFGSSFEEDVYFFLKTVYNGTIIKNSYNYIKPFQLDFYLEDVNLGIECNGDYYHSKEMNTPKDYHQNKSLLAIKNKISLIHIYEHQWYSNKQEEIKNNIIKLIKGERFEYTLDCFNIKHIDKNFKYTKPLKMEHSKLTIYNSGKFIK